MDLSKEQEKVIDAIIHQMIISGYGWRAYNADIFKAVIAGYAGTGKTTMLAELRKQMADSFKNISVAFVTFTGKAASVLKQKLIQQNAYFEQDYIGTIHGLIYEPETKYDPQLKCHVIVNWKRKDEIWQHIVVIDEASMVSKELIDDLRSYDKSIIAVGDHGQLPPVGSKFNLLKDPDFVLTKIHRQALNSPIIKLSQFVRRNGYIPNDTFFSKEVFKLNWKNRTAQKIWNHKVDFKDDLIVLCAFNTTRCALNDMIREKLGFRENLPYPSEKIICLQNDHEIKIMNGQIGELLWLMPSDYDLYRMTIDIDQINYECMVSSKCFGQVTYTMHDEDIDRKKKLDHANERGFKNINYFDYGYATSVHKSQGSEWQKVIVFEQRTKRWDDDYYTKWLYTAITRAKEKLFIISDAWI